MLPTSAFARVTIQYTGVPIPQGAATVFCVSTFGGATPFGPNEAEAVVAAFGAIILPELDDGIVTSTALVKVGPDLDGPIFEVSGGVEGGVPGSAAPPNVSYLVSKSSSIGGRRGRGRMYLPGVNEDSVTEGGIIDGSRVAALQVAMDSFLTQLPADEDNPTTLMLEHSPSTHWELVDGQPRRVPDGGDPPDPNIVNLLTVSNRVATQRRRLR